MEIFYLTVSFMMLFAYICKYRYEYLYALQTIKKVVWYSQKQWFMYNENSKDIREVKNVKNENETKIVEYEIARKTEDLPSKTNGTKIVRINDEYIKKVSYILTEPNDMIVRNENEKRQMSKKKKSIKICEDQNTIHHYYYRATPPEDDIFRLTIDMSLLLL